jgi:hypothetical protein
MSKPLAPSHHAFALAALLAITAHPGASAAPLISQGAYTDEATKSCTNAYSCTARFTPIPAGKTLIVQNISCYIHHSSAAQTSAFRLTSGSRTVWLPLGPSTVVGTTRRYFPNLDLFAPIRSGQTPSAYLSFSNRAAGAAVTCTIAGELRP